MDAKVWALTSFRAGENEQIMALVDRLCEPWVKIQVTYTRLANPLGLMRMVSARGIRGVNVVLKPPWPALVVTASLRNEPVCRWIKRASGGRTRIVCLGRTWAPTNAFDLVISTPQYRPKPAQNLYLNPLTIHAITPARLQAAAERACSSAPRSSSATGVLVGGDSGPFVFDETTARAFAARLAEVRRCVGGNLVMTTSARTPAILKRCLADLAGPDDTFYEWRPADPENPLMNILANSERLIVTGDSIAMLSDAIGTGKPVFVYDIPTAAYAGVKAAVYRAAMLWGPRRWSRDVKLVHQAAFEAGWARPLADLNATWTPATPDYIEPTVARVRALLE